MDALMTLGRVSLPMALAAAQQLYGSSFNPEITLKALSYFDDGNLRTLAMTYALPEDMRIIRKYVSDDDFREALDRAPPGIIDPRPWAYWNSKMGRYPAPPMPTRRFGTESNGTPDAASLRDPEEQRKTRVQAWQRMLEQRPPMDPEEIRRRAAARWRDSFGPGKQS